MGSGYFVLFCTLASVREVALLYSWLSPWREPPVAVGEWNVTDCLSCAWQV
jgi:hypothetical protein